MHGWFWHVLDFFGIVNEAGPGYGFWSGFAGDLTIFAAVIGWLWHHNCHVKGCWRLGHPHEGKVACRKHHAQVHPHLARRDAALQESERDTR